MYNGNEMSTFGSTSHSGDSSFELNVSSLIAIRASESSPSPPPNTPFPSFVPTPFPVRNSTEIAASMKISDRHSTDSSGYGSGKTTPIPFKRRRIETPGIPICSTERERHAANNRFSVWSPGTPSAPFDASSPNMSEDGEATPTPRVFGFSPAAPPKFPGPATVGWSGRGQIGRDSLRNDQMVQSYMSMMVANPWTENQKHIPAKKLEGFLNRSLEEKDDGRKKQAAISPEEESLVKDMLKALQLGKVIKKPPPGYTCHICYQEGHMIGDCPQKHKGVNALTPYQGPNTCYGEFQCSRCHRKWQSCKSLANMSERCNKCQPPFAVECFPTRQFPLQHAAKLGLVYKDQWGQWRCAPKKPPTDIQPTSSNSTNVESTLVNVGVWKGKGQSQGRSGVGEKRHWDGISRGEGPGSSRDDSAVAKGRGSWSGIYRDKI